MKAYYESQEKIAYSIYYLFYNALAQLENIIGRDIIGYIGLGHTCPIALATTCSWRIMIMSQCGEMCLHADCSFS
jgi:hypothetical protein